MGELALLKRRRKQKKWGGWEGEEFVPRLGFCLLIANFKTKILQYRGLSYMIEKHHSSFTAQYHNVREVPGIWGLLSIICFFKYPWFTCLCNTSCMFGIANE